MGVRANQRAGVKTRRAGASAADQGRSRRPARLRRKGRTWATWLRFALEAAALLTAALVGVIEALGHVSQWFTGGGLWTHLLPFAAAVLALAIIIALLLRAWFPVRRALGRRMILLPTMLALTFAAGSLWFAGRAEFQVPMGHLRALVGGKSEAERGAIAHQVYAAYRRADPQSTRLMFERAHRYEAIVFEAAAAFSVDPELLMGVAATESSFHPRDSSDGGHGLFQITAPPAEAEAEIRRQLRIDRLDPHSPRHNAFVAAATLRRYLDDLRGDLFLGLLAYNIGPRNGGLRSIMQQYGAHDFVTIQPYLQHLPRDYPIRVLSAALAYRLWRRDGRLPRYEEPGNARRIQDIGIPGLTHD